ncbi:glycoside hydrolase family 18 protein [uncultured Tateyamaria sp.]|uniref:glycoside hydrolase family 18 protein n=1 Tax=Tateyamaria sp. 1078 TaxID=3417464 RepID=UPI002606A94B|nr:glycoside hydrolase family 18 protein [uncultured Tateyamaria sp.]
MTNASNPISGPVVAQYFGLFNGVPKAHYDEIVATAPFDKCNLLITAFVHAVQNHGSADYVAAFTNWRDGDGRYPAKPGDMDTDRLTRLVEAARAKNPDIKILISLGWGNNDAGNAAETPAAFAQSVANIVRAHDLDGIDIDYESTYVTPEAMLELAQHLRRALDGLGSSRQMIMTITPAQLSGLSKEVLDCFTFTTPQAYDHGGNGTQVAPYADMLGSYDTILFGLNSEGYIGQSDDPKPRAAGAKAHGAPGVLAWRLDNDSVDRATGYPTFATGLEMWALMHDGD